MMTRASRSGPDSRLLVRGARRRGFTLIELVVVVAILGIVAGIAVPRMASAVSGQRAEMAVVRVSMDMDLVAEMARSESRGYTVTFDPGDVSYTVSGGGEVKSATTYLASEPYGLTGLRASFGASKVESISVDGFGRWLDRGVVQLVAGSRSTSLVFGADPDSKDGEDMEVLEILGDLGLDGKAGSPGFGGK
jgi:prepilin-type N-terminal cleavage/methylation domain-containing protein